MNVAESRPSDAPMSPRSTSPSPGYAHRVPHRVVLCVLSLSSSPLVAHEDNDRFVRDMIAERLRAASTSTRDPSPPSPDVNFAAHYPRLGRTKGPDAAPEARRALRDWWISQGPLAARWLVGRIADESRWDVLHAVIDVLVGLGVDGVAAARHALCGSVPNVDARLALLKVLLDGPCDAASRDEIESVARGASHDPDVDVREVAEELIARVTSEPVTPQHG